MRLVNHARSELCVAFAMIVLSSGGGYIQGHEPAGAVDTEKMREAALAWRAALGPELARRATFAFDGSERTDWHFVPKDRAGVSWHEMDLPQRRAAHRLLRTALSSQGYLKAAAIMSLEEDLRRVEASRPNVERIRDPEKYWFALFGDPASDGPWGWRIEGHHLSLNFSSLAGQTVAVTPAFFGANPAELRDGPRAGLRILGGEEDLARELITGCDAQQRSVAIIAEAAPRDILIQPGMEINFGAPAGLAAEKMSAAQQTVLRRLLDELIGNFNPQLRDKAWREIEEAGFEKLHFAWAGGLEPGEGHYFRIHGPTLVIEYDNTQNDANHIHLVWHSPGNNFAADFLRRHYTDSPHHQHE